MIRITSFCDSASRLLLDPSNTKFAPKTRAIAWSLTIVTAIATLGLAQGASVLWRRLRKIEEPNETHEMISQIFQKIIGKKERLVPQTVTNLPVITTTDTDTTPTNIPQNQPPPVTQPASDPTNANVAVSQSITIQPAAPTEPAEQLSSADLKMFRAALLKVQKENRGTVINPIILVEDQTRYCFWYNSEDCAIFIEKSEDWAEKNDESGLGLIIDSDGEIVIVKIDREIQDSTKIPEKFLPLLQACFAKSLEISTSFLILNHDDGNRYLLAMMIRRGLKKIPDFHLTELSKTLKIFMDNTKIEDPKIKVVFLNDDLSLDQGVDEGGLTRDYFDDLMEGFIQSEPLLFQKVLPSSLVMPRLKSSDFFKEYKYKQLGRLIMYCYHSQPIAGSHWNKAYTLGFHFDYALFKAVLCLTAKEIDTSFEALSDETNLKMGKALLDARIDAGDDMQSFVKLFNWISHFRNINCSDGPLQKSELEEPATHLMHGCQLPKEWTVNNEGEEPDMDKIYANRALFLFYLEDLFFNSKGLHGEIGRQIRAIHAIADGMKSFLKIKFTFFADEYWNETLSKTDYLDFSDKVQGCVDRKEIASKIELDGSVVLAGNGAIAIQEKVDWLKEWIVEEATSNDLRNLLKFLTGSTSMPKDAKITVISQVGTFYPVPIAHTCGLHMEISPVKSNYGKDYNDHDKANFIKSLKDLALANPSVYQMS